MHRSLAIAIALGAGACATGPTVCPAGTRLQGAPPPLGQAQWCGTMAARISVVPVPGRTFADTLGIAQPTAPASGVEGPATTWYPDGTLQSHGHFASRGLSSVPHGVWGFWYPSGLRHALGEYEHGEPVGCFALWAEDGTPTTAVVEGGSLREAHCTPPPDDELVALEGGGRPPEPAPVRADILLQGYATPGEIGARGPDQVHEHPSLALATVLGVRKRAGPLRLGATGGFRLSGASGYHSYTGAAIAGLGLPVLHHRLDAEVSLEVGAQHISAMALRPDDVGSDKLNFWAPFGAAQAGLAFTLTPGLEALIAARVDGTVPRREERDVMYCSIACERIRETWRVGGFTFGAAFGLRFLVR